MMTRTSMTRRTGMMPQIDAETYMYRLKVSLNHLISTVFVWILLVLVFISANGTIPVTDGAETVSYTSRFPISTNTSVSTIKGQVTKMIPMKDVNRILVAGTDSKLVSIPYGANALSRSIIDYNKLFQLYDSTINSIDYISGGTIVYAASSSISTSSSSNRGSTRTGASTTTQCGTAAAIGLLFGRTKNMTLVSSTTSYKGLTITLSQVSGAAVKFIDMNKDGKIDIVATIYGTTQINNKSISAGMILLFTHTGNTAKPYSSTNVQILSESLGGKSVFGIGDCDQNKFLDIPILGIDSKTLHVLYQETDYTYTQQLIESNISNNYAIDVNTFNDDIAADIVTVGTTGFVTYIASLNVGNVYAGYRGFSKSTLFLFDSTSVQPYLSKDYKHYQIQIYDTDNDTLDDVVSVFGGPNTYNVRSLKQLPQKRMTGPNGLLSPIVYEPDSFLIFDITNDTVNDIIVHSETDDIIYVYPGKK